MAFQAMMGGAECSTSNNGLARMLKHTQADRSLQQGDRTTAGSPMQHGGGMRHSNMGPTGVNHDAEAFFRQQQHGHPGTANFDMGSMRNELQGMANQFRPPPLPSMSSAGWADQMARAGPPSGASSSDMEAAFARGPAARPTALGASNWGQQFASGGGPSAQAHYPQPGPAHSEQPTSSYSQPMMGGYSGAMYGGGMGMMGMSMGMGMGMGMGGGLMSSQAPQQPQQPQQQQQRFVELDDAKWEEQFKKLDEERHADSETKEADADTKGKGKQREDDGLPSEAEQNASIQRELDAIEQQLRADSNEATSRFEELWKAMHSQNGVPPSAADAELAKWEEELMKSRDGDFDWSHPGGGLGFGRAGLNETGAIDGTEDALLNDFETVGPDGYPRLGTYRFSSQNAFQNHPDPLTEGLRLLGNGGSLSDAALLFEAATQRESQGGTGGEVERGEVDRNRRERSEAWRRLGECQAMNEKETQAIRALEEAIRIDENNLEAYMSLAISYTNEGYDTAAHATLERYIQRAYPHLKPAPLPTEISGTSDPIEGTANSNPWATLNKVTDLFLAAAREGNAKGQIDPEVQVGLGVLFYSNSSYDQARDCFQTALQARPNDFLLWNRLGATLANGGKPEEAIEAYHKALELRPTFTRAIYNLSVSCLNLGAHHEAAEHLLAALSLQQTHTLPDVPPGEEPSPTPLADAGESHNLWSTLRRIFLCMDRMDLAQHAHVGSNLEQFRGQGFEF
ncbi:Peroxisomal membrane signal receptor PTS1 [Thecaphora frezii]